MCLDHSLLRRNFSLRICSTRRVVLLHRYGSTLCRALPLLQRSDGSAQHLRLLLDLFICSCLLLQRLCSLRRLLPQRLHNLRCLFQNLLRRCSLAQKLRRCAFHLRGRNRFDRFDVLFHLLPKSNVGAGQLLCKPHLGRCLRCFFLLFQRNDGASQSLGRGLVCFSTAFPALLCSFVSHCLGNELLCLLHGIRGFLILLRRAIGWCRAPRRRGIGWCNGRFRSCGRFLLKRAMAGIGGLLGSRFVSFLFLLQISLGTGESSGRHLICFQHSVFSLLCFEILFLLLRVYFSIHFAFSRLLHSLRRRLYGLLRLLYSLLRRLLSPHLFSPRRAVCIHILGSTAYRVLL